MLIGLCCCCLLSSLGGRRENIAPDYPLTLLEGMTTIAHYCLLENKRVRTEQTHTHRVYNSSYFICDKDE